MFGQNIYPFLSLLTLFLTIRHIDCTVFRIKNRVGLRLPTTRVCPAWMAATSSSASAASISVAPRPNVAAKSESDPVSTSWGEPGAGSGGPQGTRVGKHIRALEGTQKRRKITGKARLLLNIALQSSSISK